MFKLFLLIAAVLGFPLLAVSDDQTTSKPDTAPPRPVEIRHQAYARYTVAGLLSERGGGWGRSNNFSRKIVEADGFGEPEQLSIVVDADEQVPFCNSAGIRVRIVNRSGDRTSFSAIDSHLYLIQEARNEKGEWQAIEKMPHGTGPRDCAVGFHSILLQPSEYWNIVAPRYKGSQKAKLRFRLDLGTSKGGLPQSGGRIVYSNEFEGSVNPEQFQRGGATPFDLRLPGEPR